MAGQERQWQAPQLRHGHCRASPVGDGSASSGYARQSTTNFVAPRGEATAPNHQRSVSYARRFEPHFRFSSPRPLAQHLRTAAEPA